MSANLVVGKMEKREKVKKQSGNRGLNYFWKEQT